MILVRYFSSDLPFNKQIDNIIDIKKGEIYQNNAAF